MGKVRDTFCSVKIIVITGFHFFSSSSATRESEGAVGGVSGETNHMTGSDTGQIEEVEEEEEVPIDEDLFAAEELENLELEDVVDLEPGAVD